jgi:hypothetical protein
MKRAVLGAAIALTPIIVAADTIPQQVTWPGWTIFSSDDLGFSGKHRYPVTYIFDGDPSTAWVFKAKFKHVKNEEGSPPAPTQHSLMIELEKPTVLDGLRIMNGYNKSEDLYFANDRVVAMEIWSADKRIKTVKLADRMGWHDVSLPHAKYSQIKLVFTGIVKGEMDDICISELRLTRKDLELPVHLTAAVIYATGSE